MPRFWRGSHGLLGRQIGKLKPAGNPAQIYVELRQVPSGYVRIAIKKLPFIVSFPLKCWFSIVMLVYQRVLANHVLHVYEIYVVFPNLCSSTWSMLKMSFSFIFQILAVWKLRVGDIPNRWWVAEICWLAETSHQERPYANLDNQHSVYMVT